MAREIINVAIAADAGYAIGLATAAISIAYHASKDIELSFYFLDGGIPDAIFKKMEEAISRIHPFVQYYRIPVDQTQFAEFPDWRGNKMAYARFLLIENLKDIDHLIYCDADFLWRSDIAELWSLRDEKVTLQAVVDPLVENTPEPQWFIDHGYQFPHGRYLNSGLLLMNLKKLRQERFVPRAFELIREHPDFLYADQESFVLLLEKETRFLDKSWMRFTKTLTSRDFDHPLVCHYVNDLPWGAVPSDLNLRDMLPMLKDAPMAWRFMAQKGGLMNIPLKLRLFYFLTRLPIVKNLFYLLLKAIGKHGAAACCQKECSATVDV